MTETDLPFISIIIPIRNEAAFIKEALRAVFEQDYPKARFEVIVVDGMSDDGTLEIIDELKNDHLNLRLIENPKRIVPPGFNAALKISKGEIITRIDGHSTIAKDFLRQNVELLKEYPDAWCSGGPIVHKANTDFGKAVAIAMSHRLGVGNATHRFPNYEGYVEGAQFPTIWRWVFDRIGGLDESLSRNEDDEFNYRIKCAGGKVVVSPKIKYEYYVRENIKNLFGQYLQYGFWRIPVMKKHKQPTTFRQVVPMLFYMTCFALILIGVYLQRPLLAIILPLIYLLALLFSAIQAMPRAGFTVAYRVPIAIATMHAGYGFGMMYGFWASIFNRNAWDIRSKMSELTR